MSKGRMRNRLLLRSGWWDTFAVGWFGALALAAAFDAIEGREPWGLYVPLWGALTVLVLVVSYVAARKAPLVEEESSGSRLITADEAEIMNSIAKSDSFVSLSKKDQT